MILDYLDNQLLKFKYKIPGFGIFKNKSKVIWNKLNKNNWFAGKSMSIPTDISQ